MDYQFNILKNYSNFSAVPSTLVDSGLKMTLTLVSDFNFEKTDKGVNGKVHVG